MRGPVQLAFASGSPEAAARMLEQFARVRPELPVWVVSEFPPPVGAAARWIRWHPGRSGNRERMDEALRDVEPFWVAVLLEPGTPYGPMRRLAMRRWPLRLLLFNENGNHFPVRPSGLKNALRHLAWRLRSVARRQLRPGGGVHTALWRLAHPSAFLRPVARRAALVSGAAARAVRKPAGLLASQGEALAPGISVVIPSRNGRELLERLFDSFPSHLDFPLEVLVVDNGSSDGTAEWLRAQHPTTVVMESSEALPFAVAVNRGIQRAGHTHICLLNNDMVLEAGFFDALRAPFATNPDLFAATAQIFFPEGVRREETGKAMYHPDADDGFPVWCDPPIPGEDGTWVLYGSGGCTLYDTAKLRALGGFGEQFVPAYVEDLDLGWRAWRQGWPTVFAAGARVLHLHRSTTSKYYSAEQLETALEQNFVRFSAGANSGELWRAAIARLNRLTARVDPVPSAEAALRAAWLAPWTVPISGGSGDGVLALCSGGTAVFPGRPASGRPRLLVATPYLPFPLSHGGAVRMYNLLREAVRDLDLVMLSFAETLEPPPSEILDLFVETVIVTRRGSHLPAESGRPEVVEEHDTPAFREALRLSLAKWQPRGVQLEFTQMAAYAADCAPRPVLLVEHDITLDLYAQLAAEGGDWDTREQAEKWERFERQAWPQMAAVVVMSEKDRAAVGAENAVTLANGVDLDRFTPSDAEPEPRRILFLGSFGHLPNLLALDFFLREAWPALAAAGARLHVIAGHRHEEHLRRWAERVAPPLHQPGIAVDGFVADVRPAYRRAEVVIAPLVASAGTNIKVLEAMAMGKAVVATPAGVNGLEFSEGEEFLLARTGAEFATAVEGLFADAGARRRLEEGARRAAERYGWDAIGRKQAALYRKLGIAG